MQRSEGGGRLILLRRQVSSLSLPWCEVCVFFFNAYYRQV